MATYDGFTVVPRWTARAECHSLLKQIGASRSKLAYDFSEHGSGSYPSGGYPSGVAALGVPVIEVAAGGNAVMYAALSPGQSVVVPVFASPFGKCVIKILDGVGPIIAADYSADSDEWETLIVTLPSGYAAGIYLVEIANNGVQDEDDTRAWFGPIEVI